MTEQKEKSRSLLFDSQLSRVAAMATLLALLITAYVAVKPERRKELEIQYLARLSMISHEAALPSSVQLTYDGRQVKNLTKLLARVVNVGDLPVETRDVEQPISISFAPASVLDVQIV